MNILLVGGTGHLGFAIAKALKEAGYEFTALVRNSEKAKKLSSLASRIIIANVQQAETLVNCCYGIDVVISALGKSVSLNDTSKESFDDIDYLSNVNILKEAKLSRINKFIYVSAFHAEKYNNLSYFKAHEDFSRELMASGLNFCVVKPPALFSAFIDAIEMAQKGRLITLGRGDKKTNPIYEGDLAKLCVSAIEGAETIVEAGGPDIYTRHRLNEIICKAVEVKSPVKRIPLPVVKLFLPIVYLLSKNSYDKLAFYVAVSTVDTIAPKTGSYNFEEYIADYLKGLQS